MRNSFDEMKAQDAIALLEKAIVWCHLRDLPKTKASMETLLDTLHVAQIPQGDARRWSKLLH